jgi:hypothetical protein
MKDNPNTDSDFGARYWLRARIGDPVFDVADPRHVGRIVRINWTTTARVRWLDTGWYSDLPIQDLRRANERDLSCQCGAARPGDWTAGVHHGFRKCARVVTRFDRNDQD